MNPQAKNPTSSATEKTAGPVLQTVRLSILSNKTFGLALLIGISIVAGLALPFAPAKIQVLLIAVPVALIIGFLIILYPFLGIIAFFLYDYMRPDNYFAFLIPLHLAMLIEILTVISWIIHLLIRRTVILWTSFNWVFVAFLGVMVSTIFTAENPTRAYNTSESMIVLFVIFLICSNVVNTMKKLKVLVFVLSLIHFYFAIKGIQTGGFVGGTIMFDENDLALAMNIFIPFAYFAFMGNKTWYGKVFYLAMMTTCVLSVVISMSRGGFVGLIAVVFYLIMKSKQRLATIAVVFLIGMVVIVVAPSKYWDDVQTITDMNESTAHQRILYWQAAGRMVLDNPLTGVGAGNGGIRMPEFIRGVRNPNTEWGRTFHGTVPQIAGELGLLGLSCYLLMLYLAIKTLLQIRRRTFGQHQATIYRLSDSFLGGIIAFIVTGTFLSTAYYPQLWTMYTLTITLVLLTRSKSIIEPVGREDPVPDDRGIAKA